MTNQTASTLPAAYVLSGGLHPDTAALTALLAHAGAIDPATGAPFTEAMVLGIGGGLGMGYILWEFKSHNGANLVMGMTNRWQYSDAIYTKLAERLQVTFAVAETGSARGAAAALDAAFGLGRPAMLWVDQAHLPWHWLPESMSGYCGHTLVAFGAGGDEVLIDDRGAQPFRISRAQLAAARGRIGSYKNRLLTVDAIGAFDLRAALVAGLRDCADHLAQPSDSFSLPVIRKWARLLTDTKNAKGWPRVFADGRGLFSALISIFEATSDYGAAGGSLRALYAGFLDEAAQRLDAPALHDVAERYRALGLRWSTLGESALDTQVAPLAAAKELVATRDMFIGMGGDEQAALAQVAENLARLHEECDAEFPLDAAGRLQLMAALQGELNTIYDEEVAANQLLQQAVATL